MYRLPRRGPGLGGRVFVDFTYHGSAWLLARKKSLQSAPSARVVLATPGTSRLSPALTEMGQLKLAERPIRHAGHPRPHAEVGDRGLLHVRCAAAAARRA